MVFDSSIKCRGELVNDRRVDINGTSLEQFEILNEKWDLIVSEWEESINKLRDKYPVLSFYTVTDIDMRFICNEIEKYLVTGQGSKKQSLLVSLTNPLSILLHRSLLRK